MYVVFDTNVWRKELGLNSSLGSVVRYFIKKVDGQVCLPEIVKLETEYLVRSFLLECLEDISKRHRELLALFGVLKELVLPTEAEIDAKVATLFDGLGVNLHHTVYNESRAKNALSRTIQHQPPSVNGQQYKDCILWEDCISLLEEDDVYLVTADKGFYQDKDLSKGLNNQLMQEAANANHELKLFAKLQDLLEIIKTDVAIPDKPLLDAYESYRGDAVRDMANQHGFALTGEASIGATPYATSNPSRLHVEFTIEYLCEDNTSQDRGNATVSLSGHGSFNTDNLTFSELLSSGEKLKYTGSDGTEETVGHTIMAFGNVVMGHRDVTHSIRKQFEP